MERLISKSINILIEFIRRHEILCLFCLVYFIYNINGRTIAEGDTIPASLLPFNILENHNLYLDSFYEYFTKAHYTIWFFTPVSGHYLSTYPIVTPALITPLYVIPYLLLKLNHFPIALSNPEFSMIVPIMEKLTASFITVIAVIFVYLFLKELISKRIALIGAMIFAFATDTWTTSSQGLWQHGLVELLLAASIYIIILNEKSKSNKNIMFLGILSGLFVFNRPVDSILLVPILYYILNLRDQRIAYYFGSMALSGGPFLLYNFYYFGNLFGGYGSFLQAFSIDTKNLISFAGLLISPSRGLFIYSPILIFSIFGYIKSRKIENKNVKNLFNFFGIAILTQILIYSFFNVWWAGGSYGPRFLTGMLPGLFIFLGLYIEEIHINIKPKKNLFIIFIFSILLIWSIFVQIVGAFYYPNGDWNGSPNVDLHPEKCWYWNDTQIMRSFNAGIISPGNYIKTLQTIANPPQDIVAKGNLGKGWYGIDTRDGTSTRWMENDSLVTLYSPENRTANLSLRLTSLYRPRTIEIYAGDELALRANVSSTEFEDTTTPIHLMKGTNTLRFHIPEGGERPSDIKELNNPDPRYLSVAVQNISVV